MGARRTPRRCAPPKGRRVSLARLARDLGCSQREATAKAIVFLGTYLIVLKEGGAS